MGLTPFGKLYEWHHVISTVAHTIPLSLTPWNLRAIRLRAITGAPPYADHSIFSTPISFLPIVRAKVSLGVTARKPLLPLSAHAAIGASLRHGSVTVVASHDG